MDFVTALIYGLALEGVIPKLVAAHLVAVVWGLFAIMLAGLVAELSNLAGMGGHRLWAVMVALAPPLILPFFLLRWRRKFQQKGFPKGLFDYRGAYCRRQGYRAALVALIIWSFISVSFIAFASFKPAIAPPRPTSSTL